LVGTDPIALTLGACRRLDLSRKRERFCEP
jgi:hypothetical protein